MITKEKISSLPIKHFTLGELTYSATALFLGLSNMPSFEAVENLYFTAQILEVIRGHVCQPIVVNSGFRSEELNERVHGVPNSLHLTGHAVDFSISSFSDDDYLDLHAWLFSEMPWLSECILYFKEHFIHLAYSPTKTMPCFKVKINSNPKKTL